jgi:putative SOS response-associated peptidase YedK
MPDRFTLTDTITLSTRFSLPKGVPAGVKLSYNISPTKTIPVVLIENDERVMKRMKWGFVPTNAKDFNSVFRYKTHHARSEDVFSKPTWQGAVRTRRCLIPASGFYEWRKAAGGKEAYYLQPVDQPLFAFAGIYSEWTNAEGVTYGITAIVTTPSDSESDAIPSRLPVIVDSADEADWLNPTMSDVSTLLKIMRPLGPDQLRVTRVGDAINSVKAKSSPALIAPYLDSAR